MFENGHIRRKSFKRQFTWMRIYMWENDEMTLLTLSFQSFKLFLSLLRDFTCLFSTSYLLLPFSCPYDFYLININKLNPSHIFTSCQRLPPFPSSTIIFNHLLTIISFFEYVIASFEIIPVEHFMVSQH